VASPYSSCLCAHVNDIDNLGVSRLRDSLLKCAAYVKVSVRQVLTRGANSFPFTNKFCLISQRLSEFDFSIFD
jgi:hypothetical protein